jgi:Arc/MetJ-type ribon-helix-helix transcriptional regulator
LAERMYRAQILLEPAQHKALAEIAQREESSISEVVREILGEYLDQQREERAWEKRMQTLKRLGNIRERVEAQYGVYQGDLIGEARSEHGEDTERVWKDDA